MGRRGVEKVAVASLGKGWSGGAGIVAAVKGQAEESALDWKETGSAGLAGAVTGPGLGACAVGDSWGWAEQATPSAAGGVAADRPVDCLRLLPRPGGAGPSVPCRPAASAACGAAIAAAAAAAVGNSPHLGAAGTGYGWPFRDRGRDLPLAAAAAAVSGCPGTARAWRCGSCSFAAPGGSDHP